MGILHSSNQKDKDIITGLDKFIDHRFEIVFQKLMENSIVYKENYDDFHYGKVIVLQNINMKEFYLVLKEQIFNSEMDSKKTIVQFQNRALQILHPNLIQLHTCSFEKVDNFCSSFYKASLIFDFITKSLEEELINLKSFSEDDIWFLLDSLIGAMNIIQTKGLKHQNLRMSTIYSVFTAHNTRLFKISDQELMQYQSLYDFALENYEDLTKMKGVYLSPEQMFNLKDQTKSPKYDIYYSDVFTCGMLIAQLALWKPLDEYYDFKTFEIREQSINTILREMKQKRYTDELIKIVQIMLQQTPEQRFGFQRLDSSLHDVNFLNGRRISNHLTPDKLSFILQLPEELKTKQVEQPIQNMQQSIFGNPEAFKKPQQNEQNTADISINQQKNDLDVLQHQQDQNTSQQIMQQQYTSQIIQGPQQSQQGQPYQRNPQGLLGVSMHNPMALQMQQMMMNPQLIQYMNMMMMMQQQQMINNPQFQQQMAIQQSSQQSPVKNVQFDDGNEFSLKNMTNAAGQFQRPIDKEVDIDQILGKNESNQPQYREFQQINNQNQKSQKLTFNDGKYYEGEVLNGQMKGIGVLYSQQGQIIYKGQFENNLFHREGVLTNINFQKQNKSEINYQNFDTTNFQWQTYEGQFKHDFKDGIGTLVFGNNEKFIGNFQQDHVHGYGTFYKLDGQTVNGYWENGQLLRHI